MAGLSTILQLAGGVTAGPLIAIVLSGRHCHRCGGRLVEGDQGRRAIV
jgi:hypothetical protein